MSIEKIIDNLYKIANEIDEESKEKEDPEQQDIDLQTQILLQQPDLSLVESLLKSDGAIKKLSNRKYQKRMNY